MDYIANQLSPEAIAFIEQSYNSLQLWLSLIIEWSEEEFEAFFSIVQDDIQW